MILSIIVPVYNVEQYLERCVDSLIAQDLDATDYEIIMVNDGSTDNSQTVAEGLVQKYPNVSLYNQKNLGLSGARNTGMLHAQGKYIMFVDSDDYLECNCLKKLIDTCENFDLDVCHYYLTVQNKKGSFSRSKPNLLQFERIYTGKEVLQNGLLIGSVCSNIYKTVLLQKYKLFFFIGITHEDVEFSMRLYSHVQKLMIVDMDVYYYSYNTQSISRDVVNYEKVNKYVSDSAIIARLTLDYAAQHVDDPEIRDILIRRTNSSIVGNLVGLLKKPIHPLCIVQNLIQAYRDNGVYPVRGKCLNRKVRLMGIILSSKKIYLTLYAYRHRKHEV